MARFEAKYRDEAGAIRKAALERESEAEVRRYLAGRKAEVISIKALTRAEAVDRARKVPDACLLEFTSLLAMLLASSLSARDALSVVQQVAERKDVRNVAVNALSGIDKGQSFQEALGAAIANLPPVYRGLVKIGERTGELTQAYTRLASFLDERKRMRDAFSGAMVYPLIILVVVVVGMVGLSAYALPKLMAVFSELGGTARDTLSAALARTQGIAFFCCAACAVALSVYAYCAVRGKRDRAFAERVDGVLLRVPFLGDILAMRSMLDFTFAMESLTQAGIPLDEALLEASEALSNRFIAKGALAVRDAVRKGAALSAAIVASGAFKPYLAQWVAVGERTGRVAEVFSQLRAYYQGQSEKQTKRFIQLIEPAMTIILGVGIMILIFTFVVPLFQSMGSMLTV